MAPTQNPAIKKALCGNYLTQLGASSPAFAPRGDRLVFTTPSRGVLLSGPDASSPQPLTGARPGDRDPAWSPMGDAVVVVRSGGSGNALVRIEVPSGRTSVLFETSSALRQPAWLPGGMGVVCVAESGQSSLIRVDVPGGRATVLTESPMLNSPTVSPDGRYVVFERTLDGASTELARLALVGGMTESLRVKGAHPRKPAFSATGLSLGYVTDDGVYVADANGQNGQRVAMGQGYESFAWQPGMPRLVATNSSNSRTDLERIELPAR
jgi:Tol biopolymer transport system component